MIQKRKWKNKERKKERKKKKVEKAISVIKTFNSVTCTIFFFLLQYKEYQIKANKTVNPTEVWALHILTSKKVSPHRSRCSYPKMSFFIIKSLFGFCQNNPYYCCLYHFLRPKHISPALVWILFTAFDIQFLHHRDDEDIEEAKREVKPKNQSFGWICHAI